MRERLTVLLALTRAECLMLLLLLEAQLKEYRKQRQLAQRRNQMDCVRRMQRQIAVTDRLRRRITDAEKAS